VGRSRPRLRLSPLSPLENRCKNEKILALSSTAALGCVLSDTRCSTAVLGCVLIFYHARDLSHCVPNGRKLSHAAEAQMRRIQIRNKCQGTSLLVPISRSKNKFLAAAGRSPQRAPLLRTMEWRPFAPSSVVSQK
jgi:hypothetical protein